jgi:hypothetical protein
MEIGEREGNESRGNSSGIPSFKICDSPTLLQKQMHMFAVFLNSKFLS